MLLSSSSLVVVADVADFVLAVAVGDGDGVGVGVGVSDGVGGGVGCCRRGYYH